MQITNKQHERKTVPSLPSSGSNPCQLGNKPAKTKERATKQGSLSSKHGHAAHVQEQTGAR